MDEIYDATPHPGWTAFAAKFTALMGIIGIILCLAIAAGIVTQASHGYTRFQLGLYVKSILIIDFSFFFFLSILAFLIHVFSSNKYVGYFAYVRISDRQRVYLDSTRRELTACSVRGSPEHDVLRFLSLRAVY